MNRRGVFHPNTLKVSFGGPKSKPENIFEADAILLEPYYHINNEYAILRDGVIIGLMYPSESKRKHKLPLYSYVVYPMRILNQLYKKEDK